MKTWQSILLGSLLGFSTAGIIILIASPPHGKPVELILPSTPGPIKVYVIGAVENPGVYSIPWQSRVNDAITAAGGFTGQADQTSINLAKQIIDGEKVEVPLRKESQQKYTIPTVTPRSNGNPTEEMEIPTKVGLLNINIATIDELMNLPGIGESKATDIFNFREENGPFKSIDEIQNVPGIGPIIFDRIKDLITVDNNQ